MTGKQAKPWYIVIGDALDETITFDLDEDTGGWTTIHHVIAKHLLSDHNEMDTHVLMDSYVGMIKRNLYQAKDYVETSLKKPVYISKLDGKNIRCITLDPEYKHAKDRNYSRICKNISNSLKTYMRQTSISAPEQYKEIARRSNNLVALVEKTNG
jgi:hypothetical protein